MRWSSFSIKRYDARDRKRERERRIIVLTYAINWRQRSKLKSRKKDVIIFLNNMMVTRRSLDVKNRLWRQSGWDKRKKKMNQQLQLWHDVCFTLSFLQVLHSFPCNSWHDMLKQLKHIMIMTMMLISILVSWLETRHTNHYWGEVIIMIIMMRIRRE